jgi:hypothetical protein
LNHDVLSADDLERHWGRVDAAADIETPELVEGCTACSGLEQVMVLFHPAQAPTRAGPPKGRNVLRLLPPQEAPRLFPHFVYVLAYGIAKFGDVEPFAEVPYVVEVWAEPEKGAETGLLVYVNRTTVTGAIDAEHNKRDIDAFGCGLSHTIAQARTERQFDIRINILTPFMPITSDGKEPNLKPFLGTITTAVSRAVRKAHRPSATGKLHQRTSCSTISTRLSRT